MLSLGSDIRIDGGRFDVARTFSNEPALYQLINGGQTKGNHFKGGSGALPVEASGVSFLLCQRCSDGSESGAVMIPDPSTGERIFLKVLSHNGADLVFRLENGVATRVRDNLSYAPAKLNLPSDAMVLYGEPK